MAHQSKLNPEEELVNLKAIYGEANYADLYQRIITSYDVLQGRSQTLVGLITICLTVTGFSGPQIAASSLFSKVAICFGLFMVLLSGFVLLSGPLLLRWGTQTRSDSLDQSLVILIGRRNRRTLRYHLAACVLVIGLSGYIGSLLAYLLQL